MDFFDDDSRFGRVKKKFVGVTIGLSLVLSATIVSKIVTGKTDLLHNKKYQSDVAETLGADMYIMDRFSPYDNATFYDFVRLKPSSTGVVYVKVDNSVSDTTYENIKTVLSQYNSVFEFINDGYRFEICDNATYDRCVQEKEPVILIECQDLPKGVYGQCRDFVTNYKFASKIKELNQNCFIYNAKILLNKEAFDEINEKTQIHVIKHEFLHLLGFADIYTGKSDETSMINANTIGLSTKLSPNDLKMLYVAYGNKHINADGSYNEEKMQLIKEKIDEYERVYYSYLTDIIKGDNEEIFEEFKPSDIANYTTKIDGGIVTINGDKFTYGYNGTIQSGYVIFGEDYAILPDIMINNTNDYLLIAKVDGEFKCYNVEIYIRLSSKWDPTDRHLELEW